MAFSTKHTGDTTSPQTYWQHFGVAFFGSLRLIGYGLAGLVHAFFPEIKKFQFYTSSGIIRIYKELEKIRRHDPEIGRIFGRERLEYIQKHRAR